MIFRRSACLVLCTLLAAGVARSASAQAGPPCGPDLPIKCTPGKDAAVLMGFVGAGVAAVYIGYRLSHANGQTLVKGCTIFAEGALALREEGTGRLFLLASTRKKLAAGQQVILKGTKRRDKSGRDLFRTARIVSDQGPCSL